MRMPDMNRFAKRVGISVATAVTLALATPMLPGMAGTAYACGDGPAGQVPATPVDPADLAKVSATLSGVPTKVTRGSTFTVRLTVTNNSKVDLRRIPVGVAVALLDNTTDSPDDRLHHGTAKDVDIRYTLPGRAGQTLALKPGCDPTLGGSFVITAGGHPGSRTTVTLQVTIKSSTPAQVVDGSLYAGTGNGKNASAKFTLGKAAAPRPTTPAKPTPAKPAPAKPAADKDDAKPTTATTPPAAEALPATLPKTGGSAQTPALAIGASGLILVGATTMVLARRRRRTT
ncbi:LPXTG cell wall anchor domain-containing protein [Embleya sp. NPDC059259]|uniref:LPXTG cell wall anchor domain-containing protein n=1 Tax=unclassified Embleya TaxID=2699296 RepID=UPI00369C2D2D